MKNFILITGLIELLAGIILFMSPELVPEFKGANAMTLCLARVYGGSALTLAWYSYLVWKNFNPGLAQGFLKVFSVFHLLVAVGSFHGYAAGIQNMLGGVMLHGIMWLITLYFLLKK